MPEAISLLVDSNNPDGAEPTFRRVIESIQGANTSIRMHMFVWRCDAIGNQIAAALLTAADRGVKLHIIKDLGAVRFERIEMNRKSLLNKPLAYHKRLAYALITPTFPNTYVEDEFDCAQGDRLMAHPQVTLEWVHHTHSKYYIFDDETMITGSINIEDRHRGYRDYMAELNGRDLIRRFDERLSGKAPFDESRAIDFILNVASPGKSRFEIKALMLEHISNAKQSLYIEMAYIGDPDISKAIIQASHRGVDVTMLFSRAANIGNDINYKAMHEIARKGRVKTFLTAKMIHSKLMLLDQETAIFGSANISVFSMQKGVELNLLVHDQPVFLEALKAEIQRRIASSEEVKDIRELSGYNRLIANLQQLHQKLT